MFTYTSNRNSIFWWTTFFVLLGLRPAAGQNLYIGSNSNTGDYLMGQYNIETCTFCPEFLIPYNLFSNGMKDVVPLPNGQLVVIANSDMIRLFDPPSNTPISNLNPPGLVYFSGGVLAPSGNVLMTGYEVINGERYPRVYEYNPATNGFSIVGELSAPINWIFGDLFYWNGVLHAFMTDATIQPPVTSLVTLELGNPMTVNVVYTYTESLCIYGVASITSGQYAGVYGEVLNSDCSSTTIYNYDPDDNSSTYTCDGPASGYPYGLGVVPTGYPPATQCLCFTDAGNIPTQNQMLCAGQTLNFTNTGGFLESNDIKEFILFTNPGDTLGSIVATSATPSFAFEPPLQTGVTYYFAAMAGDDDGGSVDPDDPCLDFSNARTVVWRPLPTVSLSIANGDLCPGQCRDITATFTGTPNFTLTYSTPWGGATTQTFSGSTGTFQVCVPQNTAQGEIVVQATALTDAFCTCQ